MSEPEFFVIQSSLTPNEFLHAHPNGVYGNYTWGIGMIGACGFVKENAEIMASSIHPTPNILPLTGVIKE